MVENGKRISFVDIGKFAAMILIILLHVLQRTYPHFTSTWGSVYILVLGLAPFFFFSGLVHARRAPLRPLGFLYDVLKRGFTYFLPFIWFLLFRVLLYGQWVDFPAAFASALEYPVSALWVCWLLTWIVLFVDIGLFISSLAPRFKTLIVTLTLIIAYSTLIILRKTYVIPSHHFLGYDYFIIYTPVFLFGFLVGKLMYGVNKLPVSLASLFMGFGGLIPIAIFNPEIIQVRFLDVKWMFFLACFCAVLAIYGLTSLLRNYKWAEVFALGGRYTMEAYLTHLMLIKYWGVMELPGGWAILGMTVGLFALMITNTAAVTLVSYYVPFLHFVLFGRHYSYYAFENALFDKLKQYCLSK